MKYVDDFKNNDRTSYQSLWICSCLHEFMSEKSKTIMATITIWHKIVKVLYKWHKILF